MERVGDARVVAAALHHDGELALLVDRLGLGHLDDRRVEQGVAPEQAPVGQREARRRAPRRRAGRSARRLEPVGRAAGHDEVVAGAVVERAVLGAERPGARVHEEQLVAVGVAEELRPAPDLALHTDRHVIVAEDERRPQVVVDCSGPSSPSRFVS